MAFQGDPAKAYQTGPDRTGHESGQGSAKDPGAVGLARSIVKLNELTSDFAETVEGIVAALERGDERLAQFGLRVAMVIASEIDRIVREEFGK